MHRRLRKRGGSRRRTSVCGRNKQVEMIQCLIALINIKANNIYFSSSLFFYCSPVRLRLLLLLL